jgi:hypothetical protein
MEHKKPASTVFTSYPHYFTLKQHNFITTKGRATNEVWWLWEEFSKSYIAIPLMVELYRIINVTDTFNAIAVRAAFNNLFVAFKDDIKDFDAEIFDNANTGGDNENTFQYSIALLAFWLYQFAYSCEKCNGKKGGYDLNDTYDVTSVDTDITTYIKENSKKKHGNLPKMHERLHADGNGYLKSHFDLFEEYGDDVYEKYELVTTLELGENSKDKIKSDIILLQLMKSLWRIYTYTAGDAAAVSQAINAEASSSSAKQSPKRKNINKTEEDSVDEPRAKSSTRNKSSGSKGGKGTRKKRRTKKRGVRRCNKTQRHRKTKKK